MTAALQALVAGDFKHMASGFSVAGLQVRMPGSGMLQLSPTVPDNSAMRLLISVGVHGNETAPITMLAPLLDALLRAPQSLKVELLVVVGNPPAIALGTRFVDADLNRMFVADRGTLAAAAEAARADVIMAASCRFFRGVTGPCWHLDLHSAIRPSRYARFAVVPAQADDPTQQALTDWLGSADIDAVMFNTRHASTYSAFTAKTLGALSCTVELGQIGQLAAPAAHPPEQLATTQAAVGRLLRGDIVSNRSRAPVRFQVAQELIKRSDDFRLNIDRAAHNFTALAPGSVIATDGHVIHRVGPATEYIVFPNPRVLVGQRAALTVVRDGRDDGLDRGSDVGSSDHR